MKPRRTFTALVLVIVVCSAAVIAAALRSPSPPRAAAKVGHHERTHAVSCETSMQEVLPSARLPAPVRLRRDLSLQGFLLSPAPRGFVPRAPSSGAWRGMLGTRETHVVLRLYLARITDVQALPNPPFPSQVVWVAIADHDAGKPDAPMPYMPVRPEHLSACSFFQVFDAISATTGRGVVAGSA